MIFYWQFDIREACGRQNENGSTRFVLSLYELLVIRHEL